MPCALTEPGNYPDYLKTILKTIAVGDDDHLKACACSLRSPVTDEGCLIVDKDGKIGAFPFCSTLVEDGVGDGTNYPLKLTLKQAMFLYWQVKNFTNKFTAFHTYTVYGPPENCKSGGVSGTDSADSSKASTAEYKNRVCPSYICLEYIVKGNDTNTNPSTILGCFFASFGGFPGMKYKKEGDTYYFYPFFQMSRIMEYGFGWGIGEFSTADCPCYCCSPSLTYTSLKVKIDGSPAEPIQVAICNSTGDCIECDNFGSSSILNITELNLTK
jgi:hypothetical protein